MISGNAESVLGVLAMYIQAQGEFFEVGVGGADIRSDGSNHHGDFRNTLILASRGRNHPFPSRPDTIIRKRIYIPLIRRTIRPSRRSPLRPDSRNARD
jgi:hypothetical protein